jgi:hypothetical protein
LSRFFIKQLYLCAALFCFSSLLVFPQDDFGFTDVSSSTENTGPEFSGTIGAKLVLYPSDIDSAEQIILGDFFTGQLKMAYSVRSAEAAISLKLDRLSDVASYRDVIDEAYARVLPGSFLLEAGLRKIVWGKADSFGPLDIINPFDYRDLINLSNPSELKIARPLLHAAYIFDGPAKIEAVFVPWFEPDRYARSGRWMPSEYKILPALIKEEAVGAIIAGVPAGTPPATINEIISSMAGDSVPLKDSDTRSIEYANGGLRYTMTIGQTDVGFQYYYGRQSRPAFVLYGLDDFWQKAASQNISEIGAVLKYNPYHQIGADWAQVLFGLNLRAEAAANITDDRDGTDGGVYNPHIYWSFGFDRDIFFDMNVNFQCNEKIILMHDKIGNGILRDIEAETEATATRITLQLSKKVLREELELKNVFVWNVETSDFLVSPAIIWSKNDIEAELSASAFCGNESGSLGQYFDNNFIKTVLRYRF